MKTSKTQPIHEIRLGRVKAAVWRNTNANDLHYNVTFSRIFRDGETWKTSHSFGPDDLLLLAKVADQAHSWIHAQVQEPNRLRRN